MLSERSLQWVRGGAWTPVVEQSWDPAVDGLVASLQARAPGADASLPTLFTDPFGPSEVEDWWREIGEVAGLEPYALRPAVADAILDDIASVVARSSDPVILLQAQTLRAARVALRLCGLLERWGPLSFVDGVTPLEPFALRPPLRTVSLAAYYGEIAGMADVLTHIRARGSGSASRETLELATAASEDAFAEVQILPRIDGKGRFTFDWRSRTLRAYLWERLFIRLERTLVSFCRYCDTPFDRITPNGRASEYCPSHRAGRFRQAVREGRAPSQRSRRRPPTDSLVEED
jgi:hypothetical protein